MVEKVDEGMATKRGAQALEIGRRRQAFKTAKAASAKGAKRYEAIKTSQATKPDSGGDARVKKAQIEMRAAIKKMSDALKLSRKVQVNKGGKVGLQTKNRAGMRKTIKSKTTKRKKG